jgi:hypothetical protein
VLKIACVKIPGKGRGVVAREAIAADETVERSPVLPLALKDSECPGLNDYGMAWEENFDQPTPGRECCIGLGYLSLYNHGDAPNARLEHHYDCDEISVIALRDIAPGEEIVYDYMVPLWFPRADASGG